MMVRPLQLHPRRHCWLVAPLQVRPLQVKDTWRQVAVWMMGMALMGVVVGVVVMAKLCLCMRVRDLKLMSSWML